MPCYTVQTTTAKLEAADLDLLTAAITAKFGKLGKVIRFGAQIRFPVPQYGMGTFEAGTLRVRGGSVTAEDIATQVKMAYAKEVTTWAARKLGWRVEGHPISPDMVWLSRGQGRE